MAWKLTNGDVDFVIIHDECPDRLALLVMDVVSVYLTHFDEHDCEDDLDDV